MRFEEYVNLLGNVESFRPLTAERRGEIHRSYVTRDSGQVDAKLEALLAAETRAVRGAARRPGQYPLLVYSPGGSGPPHENAVLFEYLASHGYIIAHIPSYARRTLTKGDVAFDLAGVEMGTRDLEFTYARMQRYPNADGHRLGVLDYSWGGLAGATFAGRNHDVDAVVSFDGGIGFKDLLDGLESHTQFRPDKMRAPFLHFLSKRLWSSERYRADYHPRVPHANVFFMKLAELTHAEFASGVLLRDVHSGDVADDLRDAKGREYLMLSRYTLAFLDAYLKGSAEGRRVLERGLAGVDLAPAVEMTRSGSQ